MLQMILILGIVSMIGIGALPSISASNTPVYQITLEEIEVDSTHKAVVECHISSIRSSLLASASRNAHTVGANECADDADAKAEAAKIVEAKYGRSTAVTPNEMRNASVDLSRTLREEIIIECIVVSAVNGVVTRSGWVSASSQCGYLNDATPWGAYNRLGYTKRHALAQMQLLDNTSTCAFYTATANYATCEAELAPYFVEAERRLAIIN